MDKKHCPFMSDHNHFRMCTKSCELCVISGDEEKCVLKVLAFMLLDLLHEVRRKEKE